MKDNHLRGTGAYIPQHDGPGDILQTRWGGERALAAAVAPLQLWDLDGRNSDRHLSVLIRE